MSKTTPDKFKRPLTYEEQLQKQKNAATEKARIDKEKADKAKNQRELESLKQQESYNKALWTTANKNYAVKNKAYKDIKAAVLLAGSDGGITITPAEQQAVNYLGLQAAQQKTEADTYKTAFEQVNAKRVAKEKDIHPPTVVAGKKVINNAKVNKKITKSTSFSTPMTLSGISSAGSKVPSPLTYYYNAPMINYGFLSGGTGPNDPSPQQRTSNLSISGSDNYSQGLDAWTTTTASKGVIQTDASSAFSLANSSNYNSATYDGNLYGFKFLYNPKEVAMTWGVAEGQNWEGIAAGLDPGTSPTSALQNSTISFSLLLNRTLDMGYLNSNGLKPEVTSPYPIFAHTRDLNQELAELYEKGTMYDMEYLFKTLNGLNSTTFTGFKGDTADQGWLQGIAVELHLGNRMRYLVRVSNVEINHAMFDERMVPILSYVNISCARFPYVKVNN
jgi:hypothetical protein